MTILGWQTLRHGRRGRDLLQSLEESLRHGQPLRELRHMERYRQEILTSSENRRGAVAQLVEGTSKVPGHGTDVRSNPGGGIRW